MDPRRWRDEHIEHWRQENGRPKDPVGILTCQHIVVHLSYEGRAFSWGEMYPDRENTGTVKKLHFQLNNSNSSAAEHAKNVNFIHRQANNSTWRTRDNKEWAGVCSRKHLKKWLRSKQTALPSLSAGVYVLNWQAVYLHTSHGQSFSVCLIMRHISRLCLSHTEIKTSHSIQKFVPHHGGAA